MKTRVFKGILAFAVLFLFTSASPWEGAATVAPSGELPATGHYVATNAFPRNTIVDITNLETGRTTRALVSGGLDTNGLLAIVSRDSAELLGMRSGSVSRIRMVQPSDPIAYYRFRESMSSGSTLYDSGDVITEERYNEELSSSPSAPLAHSSTPVPTTPVQSTTSPADTLTGPSYTLEPEWQSRDRVIDLPERTYITEFSHEEPEEAEKEPEYFVDYYPEDEYAYVEYYPPEDYYEYEEEPEYIAEWYPEEEYEEEPEYIAEEPEDECEINEYIVLYPEDLYEESYVYEYECEEEPEYIVEYYPEDEYEEEPEYITEWYPEEEYEEDPEYIAEYYPVEDVEEITEVPPDETLSPVEESEYTLVPTEERPPYDIYGIDPAYIIPGITAAEPEPSATTTAPALPVIAETAFSVPRITELDRGKYYVQIAAYETPEPVEDALRRIDHSYKPVIYKDGDFWYRILLGPMNQGESAAVLRRFKSIGYDDAFVRHVR